MIVTQWILFVLLAGGTNFQTIGPFADKGMCIETRETILKTFRKSNGECIPFNQQAQAQQQAPAPVAPPVPLPPTKQ